MSGRWEYSSHGPHASSATRAAQVREPVGRRFGEPAGRRRARIEAVGVAEEMPELLDDRALPAGEVGGQTLEHAERAGAAPVVDGVGDVDAPAALVERRHHPGAEQVADVRHRPVVAEVDELVVPEAVAAPPHDRRLLGEDRDQPAQHATALVQPVGVAVDRRDQLPQLLQVVLLQLIVLHVSHAVLRRVDA